ncbi:MAG: glucose-6-phosphate isomerase [Betaproteobacteria bacterium]|nr:glucose-6-phosphate isomerase [Betaproteobacteria bacterium]
MNTTAPTDCPAWKKLEVHAQSWRKAHLAELLAGDPARSVRMIAQAPGLRLDYSRQRAGAQTLNLLAQLALERGFEAWRAALFAGEQINTSEGRAAGHTALRAGAAAPKEVREVLLRMQELASSIRSERKFRRIIHLGAGGSDLGPRLLADAFGDGVLEVRFVASADPLELERALAGAQPSSTLVIVVSKSFATQETLSNAGIAKKFLAGEPNLFAITANTQAAQQFGASEILPIPDSVGGRYSVWSAVSLATVCAIGAPAFDEFLAGGRDLDAHFLNTPLGSNVPVLLAMLGLWNVNFLGIEAHAVLPYAHRLRLLPAYLQQLEMESNGKGVDREGRAVAYATCPVVFGAEGSPAQHAFLQLLHQGPRPITADFIDASASELLRAHVQAQADALAYGTREADLPAQQRHPGNRPASILSFKNFGARDLGRLIALYEHKVFAQGVLWNLNSFDQWGVELGKQLAQEILTGRK